MLTLHLLRTIDYNHGEMTPTKSRLPQPAAVLIRSVNALPRDEPVPAPALVVDVEVGLGPDGDGVVPEHQHGREVGVAHELQAQRLDAVVHVHAVADRVVARDVQVDELVVRARGEPLAQVLVVVVAPGILPDQVLGVVMPC